jgi:NAD(P)-dependent dehydrogenase (short-subunit alcohol dehydrogenase family)
VEKNDGRIAVITGASSGLGLITAKALAAQGWRIIGHGRDPERIAAAEAAIRAEAAPGVRIDMVSGDLSLLSEAERIAAEIAQLTDRIDVLINNAGGVAAAKKITAEGNEATFTGNHLGHFVLANRLLPLLRAAAADAKPGATRIINTSSSAHEVSPGLDWDDVQSLVNFDENRAYCNVKLANILYTKALARRLAGSGIVVHAMHPGAVATRFFTYGNDFMQEYGRTNPLISAEEGADTLIWLATAEEPAQSTGGYWHERKQVPPTDFAQSDENAERLWEESEKIVAACMQSAA